MLSPRNAIEHYCMSPSLHTHCSQDGCPLQLYAPQVACELDRILNI
jgi:hypothetical protein